MRKVRCETCVCFRGIQAIGNVTAVRCVDQMKGLDRLVPLYNSCRSHRTHAQPQADTPQRVVDDPMRVLISREAGYASRKRGRKRL